MKRLDIPLWSDTLFLFVSLFLFSFCLFRFYLRALWAAFAAALSVSAAAAVLLHLFLRARRKKKHTGESEKAEIEQLAFHLAMDSPEHNARLIANCLRAEHERSEREKNENGSKNAANQSADAPLPNAGEKPSDRPFARIRGERIDTDEGSTFLHFQFEKMTADELSPVIRAEGARKTVLAGAFTDEAKKLAEAFGVTLKGAAEVYALVKENGCMPQELIAPPVKPRGFVQSFKFRIRKSAWRGYLFTGVFLLLFSFLTVFPVYYIVSGGIMLTIAVLVRFFGKQE